MKRTHERSCTRREADFGATMMMFQELDVQRFDLETHLTDADRQHMVNAAEWSDVAGIRVI